jgi:hypothetical protein
MDVRLGVGLDTRIECWCKTCQKYVTVEEVRKEAHAEHDFAPEDMAALQAVRQYLRSRDKKRAAEAPESST